MEYKASKGMLIYIITTVVILLFVFLGYRSIIELIHSNGQITPILIHSGILIFLLGTLILCYLFAPQKYSINRNQLVIHRPISNKHISFQSIQEIRQINKSELRGLIRTFGVGGLFGNYGKFYSRGLGNFSMFGTQDRNYVLIITNNKKIVITPDDLGIIEDIKLLNSPDSGL